jgi:hypothetical protein
MSCSHPVPFNSIGSGDKRVHGTNENEADLSVLAIIDLICQPITVHTSGNILIYIL